MALTGALAGRLSPAILRTDVPAGLAVAAVALPSAIAYPAIAGLPPEVGIYSSILPLIAYAAFGSSRKLMTGPDAATMTMLAAALAAIATSADRVAAASAIAVVAGLFCLLARVLRLGIVASFLSRPILIGFMSGVSVSILVGQIGRFTGLKIKSDGLVPPLVELARRLGEVHWPSAVLGTVSLALLLLLRGRRIPAPVIVVVLATALSALFDFAGMGIATVGPIPSGLPMPAWPDFTILPLRELLLSSAAVFLVSFGAGIVSARSFATLTGETVDPNRELVGFGAADIATGLFSGFPVTASDSRTAINLSAGGQTQLTGLAAAATLAATLIFLGDALKLLPVPALGAILAAAAIGLIDIKAMRELWRISRIELAFAMISMWGAISLGVLNGVGIAVVATLAYLIIKSMHPREAVLGRIPGREGFFKLHHFNAAKPIPGLCLVLVQGSLLFLNVDYVRERLLDIVRSAPGGARWLVVDASAIVQVDSTAAAMLIDLNDELAGLGVRLGLAELHAEARRLLQAAGVLAALGSDMLFETMEDVEPAFDRWRTAQAISTE